MTPSISDILFGDWQEAMLNVVACKKITKNRTSLRHIGALLMNSMQNAKNELHAYDLKEILTRSEARASEQKSTE